MTTTELIKYLEKGIICIKQTEEMAIAIQNIIEKTNDTQEAKTEQDTVSKNIDEKEEEDLYVYIDDEKDLDLYDLME